MIDKPDKPAVGWNFLRTFHILSGGSPVLIKEMMKHNLCAVIVRILKIFLDLPPPKLTSPSAAFEYTPRGKCVTLQKLLSSFHFIIITEQTAQQVSSGKRDQQI